MAKYRDQNTGAVRESSTPLGFPYVPVTEKPKAAPKATPNVGTPRRSKRK